MVWHSWISIRLLNQWLSVLFVQFCLEPTLWFCWNFLKPIILIFNKNAEISHLCGLRKPGTIWPYLPSCAANIFVILRHMIQKSCAWSSTCVRQMRRTWKLSSSVVCWEMFLLNCSKILNKFRVINYDRLFFNRLQATLVYSRWLHYL